MNMEITPELRERIIPLRLLILDVDGVLTDGRIVINDHGEESKFFDVKDGHGLKVLMRCGLEVVWITGRKSQVVEYRAKDLGVQEYHQLIWNKVEVYEEILNRNLIVFIAAPPLGSGRYSFWALFVLGAIRFWALFGSGRFSDFSGG